MFNHSNLEDYTDPVLYDLENDDFEPDGPFYLAHAQRVKGPVLELGCGTGRITVPNQNVVEYNGHDFEEILEQITNFLDENLSES